MWPFTREKVEAPEAVEAVIEPAEEPKATEEFRAAAVRTRVVYRAYNAARTDRLSASWPTNTPSIDQDLRRDLGPMRSRSRDLFQNNDYAKRFGAMCEENIVGPNGFGLRVRIGEVDPKTGKNRLDLMASRAVESAFWEWAKVGICDITGQMSLQDIQNLYVKTVARDGEVLIRKIYGASAGNKFNFALQFLDIDRLDIQLNVNSLPDGGYIKMGVECTKYGKPVAYHLLTQHPTDYTYATQTGRKYERVPASDIFHHFIFDRAEQTRGVPWMHSAMNRLKDLGAFEEAAIISARVGASQMGFFSSPEGDAQPLADGTTDSGEFVTDADPGTFKVLPQGYTFSAFNPAYPSAVYQPFVKACVRGISSGINVSYPGLSNDLEGVNFSSIRAGVLSEREGWMKLQGWMIDKFLAPLFSEWLLWSLTSKAIVLDNGSALPLAKFDKFNKATWRGRRWAWVDPLKDMQANREAIEMKLTSRTRVAGDLGYDLEDIFAEIQAEEDLAAQFGIDLTLPDAAPPQAAADPAQNTPQASQ